MDKTRVDNGWGVGPGDTVAHHLVAGEASCGTVVRDVWFKPAAALLHCILCERA